MVVVTHRPKSVRNRYLIELFVALFVLSLPPFDMSVDVGAFVIGLNQISFFFSLELIINAPIADSEYIRSSREDGLVLR